jgi:prolipoprotein diacylglyceryltransferase
MIEFVRRNSDAALGLTQAQLTSIVMVAVGAVWIAAVAGRGQLREPTPPRFA